MKTLTRIIATFALACLFGISLEAQNTSCQAAFTYTVGTNGQVNFTDASVGTTTNTAYSWWWSGAGGWGTSALQNPVFNFNYNGTYYVYLSISDSAGGCQSYTQDSIVITNGQPCQVSFTYTVGTNGQVSFSNTSVGNISYYWSFGDGNYSSVTSPTNTYQYNGTYTVSLSSDTSGGYCWGWSQAVIVISNASPCNLAASFTTTDNGSGSFTFTDTTSTNPGNTMNWWYVNGSYVGSGNPFTYAFNFNGAYSICETVQDSATSACSASACDSVMVNGVTCSDSVFFYLVPDTSMFGGPGMWNALLYSSNLNNIATIAWTWGDGTNSTGFYPSHTYSSPGWYQICVAVTFMNGCSDIYCEADSLYRTSAQMVTVNVINGANGIHSNEQTVTSLKAYPNPFNDELTLRFISNEAKPGTYTIFDMMGNQVMKANVAMHNGDNEIHIKTDSMSKGVYFLNLSGPQGKTSAIKVIK